MIKPRTQMLGERLAKMECETRDANKRLLKRLNKQAASASRTSASLPAPAAGEHQACGGTTAALASEEDARSNRSSQNDSARSKTISLLPERLTKSEFIKRQALRQRELQSRNQGVLDEGHGHAQGQVIAQTDEGHGEAKGEERAGLTISTSPGNSILNTNWNFLSPVRRWLYLLVRARDSRLDCLRSRE